MTDGVVKTMAAICVHFVPPAPMSETVAPMATSPATIPACHSGRRGASFAVKNPAPSAKSLFLPPKRQMMAPVVADPPPVHVPNESEPRERIQRVLDEQVNPVIAGHGGGVSILDVKDNVVYVQMWGGCQGCGLADMTLKNGVEAAVRDAVPEVGEIIDLTNHRAGRNPFRRK